MVLGKGHRWRNTSSVKVGYVYGSQTSKLFTQTTGHLSVWIDERVARRSTSHLMNTVANKNKIPVHLALSF